MSKKCRRPEEPKNGETFGTDFSVGKIVRYTCDTGFVLQGASEIKCLNNRTWSGGVPSCKGKQKIHDFADTHSTCQLIQRQFIKFKQKDP